MDIREKFLGQLIALKEHAGMKQQEIAAALDIGANYLSRIKSGANPSPQLVKSMDFLHKEKLYRRVVFSLEGDQVGEEVAPYGTESIDLPAASLQLAGQQVANGRFRDLREYLVHLISQDAAQSQEEQRERKEVRQAIERLNEESEPPKSKRPDRKPQPGSN